MIEIDRKQLRDVFTTLDFLGKQSKTVLVKSLNRTAKKVSTEAVSRMFNDISLKKALVKQETKVTNANFSNINAVFSVISKKQHNYGTFLYTRQVKSKGGTYVQPFRSGQKTLIPGAFITEIKGARLVFVRAGKPRLPIIPLAGPPIADSMEDDRVMKPTLIYAGVWLEKITESETDNMIKRAQRGFA